MEAMSRSLEALADEAMALPPASRAFLAERLLETLDLEDNVSLNESWRDEIRRRCRDLENGTIESISGDEAMAEIRRSIR